MNLDQLREQVDSIDTQLVGLFAKRMEICGKIAAAKLELGKKIYDPDREQQKLSELAAISGEEMCEYTEALYACIFKLSKDYQHRLVDADVPLSCKKE